MLDEVRDIQHFYIVISDIINFKIHFHVHVDFACIYN